MAMVILFHWVPGTFKRMSYQFYLKWQLLQYSICNALLGIQIICNALGGIQNSSKSHLSEKKKSVKEPLVQGMWNQESGGFRSPRVRVQGNMGSRLGTKVLL